MASMTGAAEAYDRHVGRYGAQLAGALIDAAAVHAGQTVLDVGCGPGPLTVALADRVGAAIDPSPAFVEACQARVPGADVRVGGAEDMPFDDGAFDVVLAQLVVQLLADRDAGLREMTRVLRRGGVMAACVWDATTMPVLRSFWDAALAVAPERAGVLDDGQRVGYPNASTLGDALAGAGLRDVATGELWARVSYEGFDDLFYPFASGVGHSGACFVALADDEQRILREDTWRRLGSPRGSFTLAARAWWARATKP
jgi:SAM-dependent methyltransferase